MRLGLGMSLANVRRMVSHDPNSVAYVRAVEAARGTTIGAALPNAVRDPKAIFSDFYETEKELDLFTTHKRIWLPIYGNAAANGIDLTTCAVGTFSASGVTHAANYIQGNGSTGFFNGIVSPSGMGLTNTSGCVGALVLQADSRTDPRAIIGSLDNFLNGDGETSLYQNASNLVQCFIGRGTTTPVAIMTNTNRTGLYLANRNASGLTLRRTTSSTQTATTNVSTTATQPISTRAVYMLGHNSGLLELPYNGQIGAGYMGLGMSTANADAFAIRLRNLYQDLTGTTIPST